MNKPLSHANSSNHIVDFLVLGGGSAGCSLVARLAADTAWHIGLVEAGGKDKSPAMKVPFGGLFTVPTPHLNWRYETVPQTELRGRRGYQPRGKVLGGSSAINAMIYSRGQIDDYADWATLAGSDWAWDAVLPVYKRLEDNSRGASEWHGSGGLLGVSDLRDPHEVSRHFVRQAIAAGYPANNDFNGPTQAGVGLYQVTQRHGERCHAATFLHKIPESRLNLFTRTYVDRLLWDGQRVVGARLIRGGKTFEVMARHGVAVCLGALATPALLQRSGFGPGEWLKGAGVAVERDLPQVGRGLRDHLDASLVWKVKRGETLGVSPSVATRVTAGILPYLRRRRGVLSTNFAEAGGFFSINGEERPDAQWHLVAGPLLNHARRWRWGKGISCHVCLLRPESRGEVRLASSDPKAMPLIDPGFLTAPNDLTGMIKAVQQTLPLFSPEHWPDYGISPMNLPRSERAEDIEDWLRDNADTIYHPVSTCAMGVSVTSPVDPQLRLRDVPGVWVADASVFPTIPSGNTNAIAMMVGWRAGGWIAQSR
ncbi:MAG: GMC family oxidoreductase N-terminal domain-containing protein [Natronospirillum sp.]